MLTSMPDISIIIPCYNSGKYLPEAIDSVRQYQGKHNYEIILVDDGSADTDTLELLESYKSAEGFVVIYQENKGPSAARNVGCKSANSQYLMFLDSDNKIEPGYIDLAVSMLNNDDQVGVVYSKAYFWGDTTEKRFETTCFDIDKLLISNYIDMCVVLRKKCFDEVNGFDETLRCFEEWDLWLSIYKKNWKFEFIDKELFGYRIRSNSLLIQQSENYYEIVTQIRKKHMDLIFKRFMVINDKYNKLLNSKEVVWAKLLFSPIRKILKKKKLY